MTHRTEPNPPTAIETATAEVLRDLSRAITQAWQRNLTAITERQFRSILAGYLHSKSVADWCEDLGIEPSESDRLSRSSRDAREGTRDAPDNPDGEGR